MKRPDVEYDMLPDYLVGGFKRYIEEEGNLEPLCTLHHRGQEGIHSLDEPTWNVLRTATDPKHVVEAVSNSEIPVQHTSPATKSV